MTPPLNTINWAKPDFVVHWHYPTDNRDRALCIIQFSWKRSDDLQFGLEEFFALRGENLDLKTFQELILDELFSDNPPEQAAIMYQTADGSWADYNDFLSFEMRSSDGVGYTCTDDWIYETLERLMRIGYTEVGYSIEVFDHESWSDLDRVFNSSVPGYQDGEHLVDTTVNIPA